MKKLLMLTAVLAVLLCGCGKEAAPEITTEPSVPETTAAPTTEPTTVPTTEPEPVYINPLTGVEVEEPFDRRVFGFTIGNTRDAFPHYGVSKSDILFEAFVNGLTTRRFAMYSDVRNVESVGGIRSMRVQWSDLCLGYDAVAVHAAGSGYVMSDMHKSGVDDVYAEQWDVDYFHYRDAERMKKGYSREHCLYVRGPEVVTYAESKGYPVTQDPDKDYGFRFSEIPASETGETAEKVTITFKISSRKKLTTLYYDPAFESYTMTQYEDIPMTDGYYDNAPERYKNVFALKFPYHNEYNVYHVCETVGEGEGYFACNGKIIPILWHRASNESPFFFTLPDGTPLEQGVGNSYIAMITPDSLVEWEAAEPQETQPSEETLPAENTSKETENTEAAEAPSEETAEPSRETEETFDPSDVEVDG